MDIFIGSLPFKIKEEEVRALFEKFGEVASVKIIMDKITRQNKGYCFVDMPDAAEANKAIKELDGVELMGRTIIVNKSEEKKETKRSPFSGNFGKGGGNPFLKGGSGFGGSGGSKGGSSGKGGFNRGTFKGGSKRGS